MENKETLIGIDASRQAKPESFKAYLIRNRKIIAIAASSGLMILGLIGLSLIVITNLQKGQLSDEKKTEVLTNVLKANSLESLDDSKKISLPIEAKQPVNNQIPVNNPIVDPNQPINIINPPNTIVPIKEVSKQYILEKMALRPTNLAENQYQYSTNSYTFGPKVDNCYYYSQSYRNYSQEYYDYYPSNTQGFMFKSITRDSNNNVTNYEVNKYLPNQNIDKYSVFKGGSYAVDINYPIYPIVPDSYPVSYPEGENGGNDGIGYDYGGAISGYFGDEVEYIGIKTENGKNYYVFRNSYQSNSCITGGKDFFANVITLFWVDDNSFEITKTETYLNNENNEDNLFSRVNSHQEIRTASSANEINNIFNFDVNVQIRTLNLDTYDYSATKQTESISNYLKQENIDFVDVEKPNVQTNYVYSPLGSYVPAGFDYSRDRNFYPTGTLGDQLYDEGVYYYDTSKFAKTLVTTTFALANYQGYFPVSAYSSSETDEKILNLFNPSWGTRKDESLYKIANIQTNIGGTDHLLNARVYTYSYSYQSGDVVPNSYPISYPDSYPDSYPNDLPYNDSIRCSQDKCYLNNYLIIFESGNHKYSLFVDNFDTLNIDQLDFSQFGNNACLKLRVYNPNNQTDFNSIKAILSEIMYW